MNARGRAAFIDFSAPFTGSNPVNERCGLITGNALARILAWSNVDAVRMQRIAVHHLRCAQIDLLITVVALPPR